MQLVEIREALRQALDEEMTRDPNIFIIGEEVGHYNGAYKVTKGLLEKYGEKRVIDSPISESAFSGLAIGAAMTGLRPVVEYMSFNFSFVAFDQLVSNAANIHYMSGGRFSVPIVFRGPNGAAAQVACQHSRCVEALYSNIPGLIIVAPSNAYDAKGLLKSAIRCNNPVLFLESELAYNAKMEIPEEEYLVPIGKAKIAKEGNSLTIISHSRMVQNCLLAASQLDNEGFSTEVIDLRTIKPLDIETILSSVQKTHFCVLVEEGYAFAGISSEIAFQIQEAALEYLDAPIARVCQSETPMPYSKVLEHETVPTVERILATCKATLAIH